MIDDLLLKKEAFVKVKVNLDQGAQVCCFHI